MKVENVGVRLYTVAGINIIPGAKAVTVPDEHAKSIEGIADLKVIKETKAETVEFTEVPNTKAELAAALEAKGIEYAANASKADLQALYDGSK